MKKIISIGLILMMILIVGCGYLAPVEQTEEDGVTYIDISELVEEDVEVIEVEEDVEVVVEEEEVIEVEEEVVEENVKELPLVKVTEGDLVEFPNLNAVDPDGDKITYTFSVPLNDDGEWETEEGDAGEYSAVITASDGLNEIEQEVRIIVLELNKAPVLERMADLVIKEGETLELSPKALDPEGETLTITYSGWLTSNMKELSYDDAGEYIVRVTVSDGIKEVFQDVKVTVEDMNRPPEFVSII
jgi:nitrogen fixation protein FixH